MKSTFMLGERQRVLKQLAATGDGVFLFTVATLAGVPVISGMDALGEVGEEVARRYASIDPGLVATLLGSLRDPRPLATMNFVDWHTAFAPENPVRTTIRREVWVPAGVRSILRMLVFDGPRFVASVGILRSGSAFGPADRRRLAALAPAVSDGLIAVDRDARSLAPKGHESIIVAASGEILFNSGDASSWVSCPPLIARIRERITELNRSTEPQSSFACDMVEVRLSRLVGKGVACFLARLCPAQPLERAGDSALSTVQREVARLAAAGSTVSEIAAALGRGQETIRTHLSAAYRRLGVSSRLELARILSGEDAPEPQPRLEAARN